MTKREWWIFGAGLNASGAIIGALLHSMFVLVWNVVWLAVAVCIIQNMEAK